jgi:hypothetical protein
MVHLKVQVHTTDSVMNNNNACHRLIIVRAYSERGFVLEVYVICIQKQRVLLPWRSELQNFFSKYVQ